ncbi:hypothetical protein DFH09DRAFT_1335499 [Mycena vulgaris]|nr:hypothetical protein DFH09DRAFT_1335499 [Mycena vulgaris]
MPRLSFHATAYTPTVRISALLHVEDDGQGSLQRDRSVGAAQHGIAPFSLTLSCTQSGHCTRLLGTAPACFYRKIPPACCSYCTRPSSAPAPAPRSRSPFPAPRSPLPAPRSPLPAPRTAPACTAPASSAPAPASFYRQIPPPPLPPVSTRFHPLPFAFSAPPRHALTGRSRQPVVPIAPASPRPPLPVPRSRSPLPFPVPRFPLLPALHPLPRHLPGILLPADPATPASTLDIASASSAPAPGCFYRNLLPPVSSRFLPFRPAPSLEYCTRFLGTLPDCTRSPTIRTGILLPEHSLCRFHRKIPPPPPRPSRRPHASRSQ